MTQQRFDNFNSHFPGVISPDLDAFVRDHCLLNSRYFFVRRINSTIQSGFCTHCKADYVVRAGVALKHNDDWKCEKCGSLVIVKQAGRGRGKLIDRAYVVWYEKSVADPSAFVACGYMVKRDYREFIDIETEYVPVMRCVFKIGSAQMMLRDHYTTGFFANRRVHYKEGWRFSASIYTLIGKHFYTYSSYQSIESVVRAIKGTRFEYSPWTGYADDNFDLTVFFGAFAKYPCIEYFSKMGMKKFSDCIVKKEPLYNSINPRGKNMEQILGLSKSELRDLKESGINIDPDRMHTYKWFRKRGIVLNWKTIARCSYLVSGNHYKEAMDTILEHTSLERMIRYAESQVRKSPRHFNSINFVLTTWRDYLSECLKLQMDIRDERFLFPNNLHAAHQKTLGQVMLKEDPELDRAIIARQPSLKKLAFEYGDLFIRPIANITELFDEGGELVHCVGGYADTYADGKNVILCIRRKDEPDKPFYTMELAIPSLAVVQCRGIENCAMTEEVQAFVQHFVSKKLLTKPGQRVDTTGIRPERMEAVV